jgi:ATP-dependent DNA helicase RecG
MTASCDGFEIAGEDLKLRGPGNFFGQKQHGLPVLKISALSDNTEILKETQALAKDIIKDDPELSLSNKSNLKKLTAELFKESSVHGYN